MATRTDSTNENAVGEQSALSEYEQARAKNIERNNARLRSLGLISIAEERQSNDTAWGRHRSSSNDDDSDDHGEASTSDDEEYRESSEKKKRKKRSRSPLPPREGSRKSRRLMHLPSNDGFASGDAVADDRETSAERKERVQKERAALVVECREARQRAAIEVAKAGVEMAGSKNPTATYEHCLMRVRSMTEKGLVNRVRAIERAAGKHCVVKMAIFKSCLQDENMWELATLASESLERLKGLLPPPSD